MPAVEVKNLVKEYISVEKQPGLAGSLRSLVKPDKKIFTAVNDLSFSIEKGEVVGFLGPNGAGKTTTLKILTGILHPTRGQATVLGHEPFKREPKLLRRIALVMGNRQQLWWDLPAYDSFVVLREVYGVDQKAFQAVIDELVPALDLETKLQTQVRKLSLGERMKCELVAALIHQPEVVFLDEPTLGLDVTSQQRMRSFLKSYHARTNCTIILTSHYMQDIEELCERVIVINQGVSIYDGSMEDLAKDYSDEKRLRLSFESEVSQELLGKYGTVKSFEDGACVLVIPKGDATAQIGRLLSDLPVHDITIEEPSAEEVISDLFSRTNRPVSRET